LFMSYIICTFILLVDVMSETGSRWGCLAEGGLQPALHI
jgi:hypothetical protein